jgi:hypothetical protein
MVQHLPLALFCDRSHRVNQGYCIGDNLPNKKPIRKIRKHFIVVEIFQVMKID